MTSLPRMKEQLKFLYGEEYKKIWPELNQIIDEFRSRNPHLANKIFEFDQKDIVLITYGDQFIEAGRTPLSSLNKFLDRYLSDVINSIHILPFFPFSSDDGFSVIDYRMVNPELGSWEDIAHLAQNYQLMFDAVINHISRNSLWFQAYLEQEIPYRDYFITVDPNADLSTVFRPRAFPILTEVDTKLGKKHVWTTFGADQIDLNYANPQVLLEIISLLLFYIERGARLIRLDAIGYIWKELGTSSLNLPQAHSIVKLLRAVVDEVAPQVGLITETNVPHEENIKYFGAPIGGDGDGDRYNSGDEAHLIYQFSLAPLILHTFLQENVTAISDWVRTLNVPYQNAAFFNFIASHDGIGVMPAKGILRDDEIQALVDLTKRNGGKVSHKTNSDGSQSVYELNITLFDLLTDSQDADPEISVKRFLASQAIMLSLAGVPGIYVHSLFGSRNCYPCEEESGRARSINREKFNLDDLETRLADAGNLHAQIFQGYKQLLRFRIAHPAFHPSGQQRILNISSQVFAVLRSDPIQNERLLCLINVTPNQKNVTIDLEEIKFTGRDPIVDLIDGSIYPNHSSSLDLSLESYQTMWLTEGQLL